LSDATLQKDFKVKKEFDRKKIVETIKALNESYAATSTSGFRFDIRLTLIFWPWVSLSQESRFLN
jgi:hypothetical protein